MTRGSNFPVLDDGPLVIVVGLDSTCINDDTGEPCPSRPPGAWWWNPAP